MADHDVMFAITDNMALLVNGHTEGIASGQSLGVFFDRPHDNDYSGAYDEPAGITALLPTHYKRTDDKMQESKVYSKIVGHDIPLLDAVPNKIALLVSPVSITGRNNQMEVVTVTPDGQYNALDLLPLMKNERYYPNDRLYAYWDPRNVMGKGLVWTHNKHIVAEGIRSYLIGTIMHDCLSTSHSPIRICVG